MKTIKITLSVITFSVLVGWNNNATAQCTVDQSQLLTDAGTSERNLPGYYEGQTFTAGVSGSLCEVDLLMFNTMTGTGILNIYSGSGVGGLLLSTDTVNVNVPTGQVWQYWTLSKPPAVINGSVYTFQFVPIQGGGLPDPYGINCQDANPYSGGYDLSLPTFDLAFRTYVDITTGIKNSTLENNFVIYPNPNSGTFTIQVNSEKLKVNSEVEIYNVLGEKIQTSSFPADIAGRIYSYQINLGAQPNGVYFYRVLNKDGSLIEKGKVVIQK